MINVQAWAAANAVKLAFWGALLALFLGSNLGSYFYGKVVQRQSFAEQENKLLVKDLALAAKEGKLNAKEAELAAARTTQLNNNLNRALGDINEAINNAGYNPSCDLTDDELRGFKSIAGS